MSAILLFRQTAPFLYSGNLSTLQTTSYGVSTDANYSILNQLYNSSTRSNFQSSTGRYTLKVVNQNGVSLTVEQNNPFDHTNTSPNPTNIVASGFTLPAAGTANDFDGWHVSDQTSAIIIDGRLGTGTRYNLVQKINSNQWGQTANKIISFIDSNGTYILSDWHELYAIPPVDTTSPVITVNPTTLTVAHGSTYTDTGVSATDNVDGNITSSITTTGTVDTNTVGSYTLTYNVSDAAGNTATATRTVNVTDQTGPILNIVPLSVAVVHGTTYVDSARHAFFTATDSVDGDLTSSIVTTGTVDTATPGTYYINYSVTDAAGNTSTATRTATVSQPPTITLNGSSTKVLAHGSSYGEQGATAVDAAGNNITGSIVISGTVNTNVVGTYTITYTINLTSVTRTVIVQDETAPVIFIIGNNPAVVDQDSVYTDAGAAATDNVDTSITVVTSGAVDTAVLGTYTITYTATDAAGNTATATRDVQVTSVQQNVGGGSGSSGSSGSSSITPVGFQPFHNQPPGYQISGANITGLTPPTFVPLKIFNTLDYVVKSDKVPKVKASNKFGKNLRGR